MNVEYGVVVEVDVHFDDLDGFGMLHNARYPTLAERAWVQYGQIRRVGFDENWNILGDGFNVTKELHVGFDRPITRPGHYAVHLWVDRIGTTSATYGFRVCSADGETTYAHGWRTIVSVDQEKGRPVPWSDNVRVAAAEIQREGTAVA